MLHIIYDYIYILQDSIDNAFEGWPSWGIVLATATVTYLTVVIYNFIFTDESIIERLKESVFSIARRLPYIKQRIDAEIVKISHSIQSDMNKDIQDADYIVKLPAKGWSKEKILSETKEYCQFSKCKWEEGYASGTVYNGSGSLTDLSAAVYGLAAWSNPLHPDVFPGIRKMEAEVVQMCCRLFNGSVDSCGVMTTGGTESIILAMKAYRDYAVKVKGIRKPEALVPATAHAAFDKGASLLNMKVKHVPIDPITLRVNVKLMKKMITSNTCMLVGSAPEFSHGIIDPIEDVAQLGLQYGIPVHVDACLGGFLIVFMEAAGFPLQPFDFRVRGVTSISADTHKYGYAPKGSSVLMYSEPKYRHQQYFVVTDWPGGIYATATISGSRAGGIIAACWASLMFHGFEGYVNYTKEIISAAKKIEEGCRKIKGIYVLGKPEVSVVSVSSKDFDIYELQDRMREKSWNLNVLQFPSCIHIAVTVPHTRPGVAERFLADIDNCVLEILRNPPKGEGHCAAVYGVAQRIPDRNLVKEMGWCYLDALYTTANGRQ